MLNASEAELHHTQAEKPSEIKFHYTVFHRSSNGSSDYNNIIIIVRIWHHGRHVHVHVHVLCWQVKPITKVYITWCWYATLSSIIDYNDVIVETMVLSFCTTLHTGHSGWRPWLCLLGSAVLTCIICETTWLYTPAVVTPVRLVLSNMHSTRSRKASVRVTCVAGRSLSRRQMHTCLSEHTVVNFIITKDWIEGWTLHMYMYGKGFLHSAQPFTPHQGTPTCIHVHVHTSGCRMMRCYTKIKSCSAPVRFATALLCVLCTCECVML